MRVLGSPNPECLSLQAGDVWAFGVLLFSALTGRRPYEGCTQLQVIHAVVVEGRRPELPPDAPPALAALGRRCLAVDPEERPTFAQILEELDASRSKLTHPTHQQP